jgi:hypothetical protein
VIQSGWRKRAVGLSGAFKRSEIPYLALIGAHAIGHS